MVGNSCGKLTFITVGFTPSSWYLWSRRFSNYLDIQILSVLQEMRYFLVLDSLWSLLMIMFILYHITFSLCVLGGISQFFGMYFVLLIQACTLTIMDVEHALRLGRASQILRMIKRHKPLGKSCQPLENDRRRSSSVMLNVLRRRRYKYSTLALLRAHAGSRRSAGNLAAHRRAPGTAAGLACQAPH